MTHRNPPLTTFLNKTITIHLSTQRDTEMVSITPKKGYMLESLPYISVNRSIIEN